MNDRDNIHEADGFSGAWDPAQDADEDWLALRDLMREAEPPVRVPQREELDAIRAAVRGQLLQEGVLVAPGAATRHSSDSQQGFLDWLRLILLGGGAGAQFLRMGTVAAVVAVLMTQGGETPTMLATLPKSDDSARKDAQPGEGSTSGAAAGAVRERSEEKLLAAANIAQAPAAVADKMSADAAGSSMAAAPASLLTDQAARRQTSTMKVEAARTGIRPAVPMASLGGAPGFGGISPPDSSTLLAQALEQVQVLKLAAVMQNNAGAVSNAKVIEAMIAAVAAGIESAPPEVRQGLVALEAFRSGEDAFAAGDADEAIRRYSDARDAAQGTIIAFLAKFQIARANYELKRDYAAALAAYREAAAELPPQEGSEEYRHHIAERVNWLVKTAPNEWRDLDLWSRATSAEEPATIIPALNQLLRDYPDSVLAPDAAERLNELLVYDPAAEGIDPSESLGLMQRALAGREASLDTARILFARAEILELRVGNVALAQTEYRKVLASGADEGMRAKTSAKLEELATQKR